MLGLVMCDAPPLLFLLSSVELLAILGNFAFVDGNFDVIHLLLAVGANLGTCNNLSISLT